MDCSLLSRRYPLPVCPCEFSGGAGVRGLKGLLTSDPYDYMDAFKRVMDSTSKVQMDYICLQYPGYFRFAKWMERLAQGIADGIIEVPKDH